MKIPSASDGKHYVEPERAVDKSRTVLAEPWLEIGPDGTGTLFATDSYVAVRIPVELDDGDTPGVVPAAALKAARGRKYAGDKSVLLNGSATAQGKDGTVTVERPKPGDFPAVARFFDELTGEDTFEVMLDADKLAQVSKALGAYHGVKLTFLLDAGRSTLKPIRVNRLKYGGPGGGSVAEDFHGEGLLMPIRQKGTV